MAITFDATSNSDGITPSGTPAAVAFNATVGAGSNRILILNVPARDDTIASVSSSLDGALIKAIDRNSADSLYASIWYLVAPSVGTHTITVTCAGNTPSFAAGIAVSLFGVDQISPIEDTGSVETTGANPTMSGLTSVSDNAAFIDCLACNFTVPATMNAETNRVERASFLADSQGRAVGVSTIVTKSPAGSVTMGWDIGSNNSAYVGLALKPDGGPSRDDAAILIRPVNFS